MNRQWVGQRSAHAGAPSTVTKDLESVFEQLGVETRTAAAALALSRVKELARP